MINEQRDAATEAMTAWLSHPNELGKAPSKIECVGEFTRHDMTYFIFRYKKSFFSEWFLGVCGGYEGDSLEHCGHVFSEMQPYDPATAEEEAIEMVESIRTYWMQRAEEADENDAPKGNAFISFVLLEETSWNREHYIEALKKEWGITIEGISDAQEAGEQQHENDVLSLVGTVEGMLVSVALMPGPVPENEAEHNAQTNYRWPDAVETTKRHRAHLLVAVLPDNNSHDRLLNAGKILVKLCDATLNSKNVLGIYTSGTVFEPTFYHESAQSMREDFLPIFNWVYFGFSLSEKKQQCGYTFGLDLFGKDEIEVINTTAEPAELLDFLVNIVSYILSSDVTLHDGETIGYSEEMKLPITRSAGCQLEGTTLKIGFKESL